MSEESKDKIEDIKKTLYDPNNKSMSRKIEGILHTVNHDVPLKWEDIQPEKEDSMKHLYKKPPVSIFKKFFIISLIFFIGALGYAFYKFSNNDTSVSSDKISIKVIGNSFTKGGEELPLQIEIINNNNANLELANLIIEYPKGASDNATDMMRSPRDSLGTIKPGENIVRNIKVTLFGAEKSVRNIKVSLEYHPQGSNAVFVKDIYYPVIINLAPLSLNINAPSNVTSNQAVSISVETVLNTALPDNNSILQMTYPSNFVFESAIPAPTLGNSIWDLSSISLTNPVIVEIKGRLIGQDGEEQVFHAYTGSASETDKSVVNVLYSSALQKIIISKPFLDARILVNNKDQTEYVVSGGETVNTEVAWVNNLSTLITDGVVIVSLSGNVFDKSTVSVNNGFFDSANNQIIWDKNSVSSLGRIDPGESGTLSFSFKIPSLIRTSNTIKDPQVSIKVSMRGRQPQIGSTFDDINNFSEKIVKVSSDFQIATSASYLEGNVTPKVETETKYKITWTLSNSANNIVDSKAVAMIPIYVNWVGLAAGESKNITYNDVTREITWNIGQVPPNTGIDSNKEASFVVSIKPSLSQFGSVPQLVKSTALSGRDLFTNTIIKSTSMDITTNVSNSGGRVIQ